MRFQLALIYFLGFSSTFLVITYFRVTLLELNCNNGNDGMVSSQIHWALEYISFKRDTLILSSPLQEIFSFMHEGHCELHFILQLMQWQQCRIFLIIIVRSCGYYRIPHSTRGKNWHNNRLTMEQLLIQKVYILFCLDKISIPRNFQRVRRIHFATIWRDCLRDKWNIATCTKITWNLLRMV